jgi:hypothetical protein
VIFSDFLIDPTPGDCGFCQSCQSNVDVFLEFLSGFRFLDALTHFIIAPVPVVVCLWSMTSDQARRKLNSQFETSKTDFHSRSAHEFASSRHVHFLFFLHHDCGFVPSVINNFYIL